MGGREHGSTAMVLLAVFSQTFWYLRSSRLSFCPPLYMAIRAEFPDYSTLFAFAEHDMNVAAALLKFPSLLSLVTAFCLPIPNTLEVVSQPNRQREDDLTQCRQEVLW